MTDELVSCAKIAATSTNEEEIVLKLVRPLLTRLGIAPEDYLPEQYVKIVKIGKGKTEQAGYKPDILIRLEGYFVAVLEAKESSINVMEGWRQACEYANYLNRNDPWNSAIDVVIGCNGRELAVGTVLTRDVDVTIFNIEQLVSRPQMFADLERSLGRKALSDYAVKVRTDRGRQDASSAKARIFLSSAIPKDEPNKIAKSLRRVLNKYFVELSRLNDDDFRDAFCDPSDGNTRREIEDVMRDRAPAGTGAETLTRETIDEKIGAYAHSFHSELIENGVPPASDKFVLVLGDSGAGKSTLLEWYRRFSSVRDHFCFVKLDGTAAPQEPAELYNHLLKLAIQACEACHQCRVAAGDIEQSIRQILKPAWKKEFNELYRANGETAYLNEHFPQLVHRIRGDKADYLTYLIQALAKARIAVCVVLDNLDQTNVARQVEGFRTLRPLSEQFPIFCIMALREETYRTHENSEPFNAFHRSPIFHIPAARAADVLGRRLEMVEARHGSSNQILDQYSLDGGIKVDFSHKSAIRCLRSVYEKLKAGPSDLSLVDGICGHDIRKALDAFKMVCTSSKIGEEVFRAVQLKFEQFEPGPDSIIQALICGDWRYYCRESPLVANVYQVVQGNPGQSIFYVLRMLRQLYGYASKTHKTGKGYVSVETLRKELSPYLNVEASEVRRVIFENLTAGLWQVDTLKPLDYMDFEFVRIQLPGLFTLLTLYKEPAYLDCMAFDTSVEDEAVLDELVGKIKSDMSVADDFLRYLQSVEKMEISTAVRRGMDTNEASRGFVAK